MAKRVLLRDLRKLPKTLDGVSLTVGRTIRLEGGKTLSPGDKPTPSLLKTGNLRTLVRNGYLVPSEPVDHRALPRSGMDSAPEPKSPAEAAVDVSASSTKADIRAALETAGYDIPSGATKAELVEMLEAAKA